MLSFISNEEEMLVSLMVYFFTGSSSEIVHKPAVQDDPQKRKPVIDRAIDHLGWKPIVSRFVFNFDDKIAFSKQVIILTCQKFSFIFIIKTNIIKVELL